MIRDDTSQVLGTFFLLVLLGVFLLWWFSPRFFDTLGQLMSEGERATYVAVVDNATARSVAVAGASTAAPSAAAAAAAPYCAPGQTPRFALGFAELKRQVGTAMGEPIECEHGNPANGDTLQQTTTGLAVFERATGTLRFTNGWQHWKITADGLVSWEGDAEPLAPARPAAAPVARQPGAQQSTNPSTQAAANLPKRARVVNTDGLGVVMRSAPREDARLPRGFLEGEELTVLDRSGGFTLVRGSRGQEGWVPSQYLAPLD